MMKTLFNPHSRSKLGVKIFMQVFAFWGVFVLCSGVILAAEKDKKPIEQDIDILTPPLPPPNMEEQEPSPPMEPIEAQVKYDDAPLIQEEIGSLGIQTTPGNQFQVDRAGLRTNFRMDAFPFEQDTFTRRDFGRLPSRANGFELDGKTMELRPREASAKGKLEVPSKLPNLDEITDSLDEALPFEAGKRRKDHGATEAYQRYEQATEFVAAKYRGTLRRHRNLRESTSYFSGYPWLYRIYSEDAKYHQALPENHSIDLVSPSL